MYCCYDFMSGMKIITSISGLDNFISTSSKLLDHDGRIFHRPRFVIQTARLPSSKSIASSSLGGGLHALGPDMQKKKAQ
jgi:hypothetical protein